MSISFSQEAYCSSDVSFSWHSITTNKYEINQTGEGYVYKISVGGSSSGRYVTEITAMVSLYNILNPYIGSVSTPVKGYLYTSDPTTSGSKTPVSGYIASVSKTVELNSYGIYPADEHRTELDFSNLAFDTYQYDTLYLWITAITSSATTYITNSDHLGPYPSISGTYSSSAGPLLTLTAGSYIASVSGAGNYPSGTSVTVSATLSSVEGYTTSFSGWYNSSGGLVSTSQSYTFTMPSSDYTLKAVGSATKKKYALNVAHDSGVSKVAVSYSSGYYDGTYDGWERYYVDYGDTVTLTVTYNTGQVFAGWYDQNGTKISGSSPTNTISNFSGGYYKVTSQTGSFELALTAGSYISAVSGDGIYKYGTSVTAKATLSTVEGYEVSFSGWYDENNKLVSSSQSYTFTMPGEYTAYKAVGKATKKAEGLMHIWDGTQWLSVQPYIYNGSAWQQYIPYIYDGSGWKQGS